MVKTIISAAAAMCIFAASASAAGVKTSLSGIELDKEVNTVSFDIILETDTDFAGAEFGITPSAGDVVFEGLTMSDDLKNEPKVQTLKDSTLYLGFFSSKNKYKAGEYVIATLNYTYMGNEDRTIDLSEAKVIRIEGKTTVSDTEIEPFTITIKRRGAEHDNDKSSGSIRSSGSSAPHTSSLGGAEPQTSVTRIEYEAGISFLIDGVNVMPNGAVIQLRNKTGEYILYEQK